ncbi:MAG: zf-HC2 domain-containing protein [Gemmatimonadaceae bacterium]
MIASVEQIDSPVFDCHAAVRRLWDYLDGELDKIELEAVDAHLRECDRCRGHFDFERAFLAAVHAARDQSGASAELRARVRGLLGAA